MRIMDKVSLNRNKLLISFLTIVILLGIVFCFPTNYYILKFLFGIIFLGCIIFILYYSLDLDTKSFTEFVNKNKNIFYLLLISIAIFIPLLTENFYFQDEYWAYPGYINNYLDVGLGRIFQSLLAIMFSFVTPKNIFITRWFMYFCMLITSILIYKWILIHSKNTLFSFCTTAICFYTSIMVDCTAYSAIISYMFAIMTCACSVVVLENKKNLSNYVLSTLLIVVTFHSYQLAITFSVFMFMIKIWYSKNKLELVKSIIKYIICVILGAIIYLITLKLFANNEINQRSSVINSFPEIISKMKWFFKVVYPAAIDRIIAIPTGRALFINKNYWYFMAYKNDSGLLHVLLIVANALPIIAVIIIKLRNKEFIKCVYIILSIPCSYIIYLLLKENGYLTYYAYPLIILLLFYYCIMFSELCKKLNKNFKYAILTLVMLICFIQSNVYLRQAWVQENNVSYQYIKDEIITKIDKSNKIHVYGVPNYVGMANIYSKFAVELALRDLNYNPSDYEITVSDTPYSIGVIEGADFQTAIAKLNIDDQMILESYYYFDKTYNQYHLNVDPNSNKEILKSILTKSGLLPDDNSNIITIDLSWVKNNWD